MIKTVTVIGANGTMGRNVAGIFASFGNVKVYMVGRTMESVEKAIELAAGSVKADAIKENLIPADYSMLERCIIDSDLIFESVEEKFETKWNINKEIAKFVKLGQVICTGTSGLSIKRLAEAFPEEIWKNYMGLHFYNPPYSMTLCEIIPSEYTNQELFAQIKQYVEMVLHRTTVTVKDSPAFLGNRIGFQFINEALQYAVKYKDNGGIDYIDAILGQFSGRSMPPLTTADFVGLDVHKAIVDNVYQNTCDYAHQTFLVPQAVTELIEKGYLGRKCKAGLYKMEILDNHTKRILVYDIASGIYREKFKYSFPFAEKMISYFNEGDYTSAFQTLVNNHSIEANICLEFMLKYVLYSLSAAHEVGDNLHSADDVMATGFNWCPPLAVIQALSGVENFKNLLEERMDRNILEQIDLDGLLLLVEKSKYDYRRYFKAKH